VIYPYKCVACAHHWEVIKPVKDIDRNESCPNCKNVQTERYISRTHFYGAEVEDAEYNPGLGCIVKNKKHRADIVKRNGLIEVGNECPDKIDKTLRQDKARRQAAEWEKL
jgi:putative FmdB family regulatory protein